MGLKNYLSKLKPHNGVKSHNHATSFTDSNGLKWKLVTKENTSHFSKEFNELNSWSSDKNIQRFISKKMSIDEVFQNITPSVHDNNKLYFCYDSNIFVGLICTSTPNNEIDDGTIQYIVVNPNLQGKGYGSMMTSSVLHNKDKFFTHKFSNNINASIEEENTPSRRAFENNGFESIGYNVSSGRKYRIYRFTPKSNEMNR